MKTARMQLSSLSLAFLIAVSASCFAAQQEPQELKTIGSCRLTLVKGDICKQKFDYIGAIVNAANAQLAHGAGIAAAIARTYDPQDAGALEAFGQKNGKLFATGDALLVMPHVTKICGVGSPLYIVHAVGPRGSDIDRESLLTKAYQSSLDCVNSLEISSSSLPTKKTVYINAIAFPTISTGIFGYPLEQATPVAFWAIKTWLEQHQNTKLTEVRFVVWDDKALRCYQDNAKVFDMTDEVFARYMQEIEAVGAQVQNKSFLTPTTVGIGAAVLGIAAGAAIVARRSDATSKEGEVGTDLTIEVDKKTEQLVS